MFYDTTWSSLLTDIELRTSSLNSVLHALEEFQDIEYNNSQLSDNENLSSSHKEVNNSDEHHLDAIAEAVASKAIATSLQFKLTYKVISRFHTYEDCWLKSLELWCRCRCQFNQGVRSLHSQYVKCKEHDSVKIRT